MRTETATTNCDENCCWRCWRANRRRAGAGIGCGARGMGCTADGEECIEPAGTAAAGRESSEPVAEVRVRPKAGGRPFVEMFLVEHQSAPAEIVLDPAQLRLRHDEQPLRNGSGSTPARGRSAYLRLESRLMTNTMMAITSKAWIKPPKV